MVLPAFYRGMNPISVFFSNVFFRDVLWLYLWKIRVVFAGDDYWGLHNSIFHGLSQRIVADGPRVVHPFLVLGGRAHVEPHGDALRQ